MALPGVGRPLEEREGERSRQRGFSTERLPGCGEGSAAAGELLSASVSEPVQQAPGSQLWCFFPPQRSPGRQLRSSRLARLLEA